MDNLLLCDLIGHLQFEVRVLVQQCTASAMHCQLKGESAEAQIWVQLVKHTLQFAKSLNITGAQVTRDRKIINTMRCSLLFLIFFVEIFKMVEGGSFSIPHIYCRFSWCIFLFKKIMHHTLPNHPFLWMQTPLCVFNISKSPILFSAIINLGF